MPVTAVSIHPPASSGRRPSQTAALVVAVLLAASTAGPVPLRAAGRLVWGPKLGYLAHREVFLSLGVLDARTVTIDYEVKGRPETAQRITLDRLLDTPSGCAIAQFRVPLLEPGQTYTYTLSLDGRPAARPYPLEFKTKPLWEWRTPPPDFSFLFGSCAYINDPPYDRPGPPYGHDPAIFTHMAAAGADFMIWDGDNLYFREADDSVSGLWYRYQHDQATPELQKLFAAMPHYATWDDHDAGPDDTDKTYELRPVALRAFKAYWGNPSYGEPGNPGVYTKFTFSDAAFILLDDRSYRDDDDLDQKLNPGKSQLGPRQLDWLKNSLLYYHHNPATRPAFTFIVIGGQFLNSHAGAETFGDYRAERAAIERFIAEQHLPGIIFLTGDRHFTELEKVARPGTYPLYDLTSSPFTSGADTQIRHDPERDNPQRVPGTLVDDQNYCLLAVHGPRNERVLTITCYDHANVRRWSREIRADELR